MQGHDVLCEAVQAQLVASHLVPGPVCVAAARESSAHPPQLLCEEATCYVCRAQGLARRNRRSGALLLSSMNFWSF